MNTMIVKLFTTSVGFSAIRYNMDKVHAGDAELLCKRNLELLDLYSALRTVDLEHYFGAVASLNPTSRFDQFHAVLSIRGTDIHKNAFLTVAEKWLAEMGYARQPYLVFFHTDTKNRHLHIVSTDVRPDGNKISDSFDRVRAITHLNRLCGVDEAEGFRKDISRLLDYRCSSTFQLRILFEKSGYRFFLHNEQFLIRRYGKTFLRLPSAGLQRSLQCAVRDDKRAAEIRTLITAALGLHSGRTSPIYQASAGRGKKKIKAFRSDLADFLFSAAGLEICYLFSSAVVNGFILIDHKQRQLFDSRQIMELSMITSSSVLNPQAEQARAFQR